MHPSYFLNLGMPENDPARELKLSAEISEWLFFTNYWSHLNQVGGVSFAQYEEEVLANQLIPSAIEALQKIKEVLFAAPTQDMKFVYGWNEQREGLFCTISNSLLLKEAICLEEFFLAALTMQADIYCQL